MPGPVVTVSSSCEEVWTNERCYITELVNDPAIPELSLARCRIPPGTITQLHRLSVKEWYVIIAGRGSMEIDAQAAFEVGPGDTVVIPTGTSQRITNTGESDLHIQCLCIPRFTQECYESLESA